MAPLQSGRYTITNVRYLSLAFIPQAGDEPKIVAGLDENRTGEMWNITLLDNKRYVIRNHGYGLAADCGNPAMHRDEICGRDCSRQWVIKETRNKGQYTISPTDTELYWSFANSEMDTRLTLDVTPNNPRSQWIFTKTIS
jgi:hypothetical protein